MSSDRLCCWKSGEEGVITEIQAESALTERLQELGVVPGAWVKMVQHGCPMLIQINDSRICLRREDARLIGAQAVAAAPATVEKSREMPVGKLAVS
jgi:Fe2+ transport system protein FeoA